MEVVCAVKAEQVGHVGDDRAACGQEGAPNGAVGTLGDNLAKPFQSSFARFATDPPTAAFVPVPAPSPSQPAPATGSRAGDGTEMCGAKSGAASVSPLLSDGSGQVTTVGFGEGDRKPPRRTEHRVFVVYDSSDEEVDKGDGDRADVVGGGSGAGAGAKRVDLNTRPFKRHRSMTSPKFMPPTTATTAAAAAAVPPPSTSVDDIVPPSLPSTSPSVARPTSGAAENRASPHQPVSRLPQPPSTAPSPPPPTSDQQLEAETGDPPKPVSSSSPVPLPASAAIAAAAAAATAFTAPPPPSSPSSPSSPPPSLSASPVRLSLLPSSRRLRDSPSSLSPPASPDPQPWPRPRPRHAPARSPASTPSTTTTDPESDMDDTDPSSSSDSTHRRHRRQRRQQRRRRGCSPTRRRSSPSTSASRSRSRSRSGSHSTSSGDRSTSPSSSTSSGSRSRSRSPRSRRRRRRWSPNSSSRSRSRSLTPSSSDRSSPSHRHRHRRGRRYSHSPSSGYSSSDRSSGSDVDSSGRSSSSSEEEEESDEPLPESEIEYESDLDARFYRPSVPRRRRRRMKEAPVAPTRTIVDLPALPVRPSVLRALENGVSSDSSSSEDDDSTSSGSGRGSPVFGWSSDEDDDDDEEEEEEEEEDVQEVVVQPTAEELEADEDLHLDFVFSVVDACSSQADYRDGDCKFGGQRYSLQYGRASRDVILRVAWVCDLSPDKTFLDIGHGDGYMCLALSLLTRCPSLGVELVPERYEMSTDMLLLARRNANVARLLRAAPGVASPIPFPDFLLGSVLSRTELPDEYISRASVLFCNNFRGFWQKDTVISDAGDVVTFQEAVLHRLLPLMKHGAVLVSTHPMFSRRDPLSESVVENMVVQAHGLNDSFTRPNLYFFVKGGSTAHNWGGIHARSDALRAKAELELERQGYTKAWKRLSRK